MSRPWLTQYAHLLVEMNCSTILAGSSISANAKRGTYAFESECVRGQVTKSRLSFPLGRPLDTIALGATLDRFWNGHLRTTHIAGTWLATCQ